MVQLPAPASDIPQPVALLGDTLATDFADRPVRYFDLFCFPPGVEVLPCMFFVAASDEALERKLRWFKSARARRLFLFAIAPLNILRHWRRLRRARTIMCHGPHYFWLLIFLNRLGLFSVRGKTVQTVFFRLTGFERKLPLFQRAPEAFQAGFAVPDQIQRLSALGCPADRLVCVPWKIDTRWFQPAAQPSAGAEYLLCPGDVHRDDALIAGLIGRTGLKIIRVGRLPIAPAAYAPFLDRPDVFELRSNLSHLEYRELLRGAALVLLPIEQCDEPAGLTAALEALACERPLLANDSAGIGALLRETGLAKEMRAPNLEVEGWLEAIERFRARPIDPQPWQTARRVLESAHSLAG